MVTYPCVYHFLDRERTVQTLERLHPYIDKSLSPEDGLIRGSLGKVLYYAGLNKYYQDGRFAAKANNLLQEVLVNLNQGTKGVRASTALSRGIPGMGMVLHLLDQEGMLGRNEHLEKYLRVLDTFVFEQSLRQIRAFNLDYLHASAGAVNYLVRRVAGNGRVKEYLEALVDAYGEVAITDRNGIRFRNFRTGGDTDINLTHFGLAHGLGGVLLTLLNVYRAGIACDRIRPIVEQSLRFLLAHKRSPGELVMHANLFPVSVIESYAWDHTDNYARYEPSLGWCSSDLSQLLVLHRAAQLLGNHEWEGIAREVGGHTLTRWQIAGNLMQDTFFCHGSSGIAQMYRRLYEISGFDQYLDGYGFWFRKTLQWVAAELEDEACVRRAGELLFGWTGVSLVLLSALLETDYPWDSLFLLS